MPSLHPIRVTYLAHSGGVACCDWTVLFVRRRAYIRVLVLIATTGSVLPDIQSFLLLIYMASTYHFIETAEQGGGSPMDVCLRPVQVAPGCKHFLHFLRILLLCLCLSWIQSFFTPFLRDKSWKLRTWSMSTCQPVNEGCFLGGFLVFASYLVVYGYLGLKEPKIPRENK